MEFWRKYGVATSVYVPMIKVGLRDFATNSDWTPATGDVTLIADGTSQGNVATLPSHVAKGIWKFQLSAAEAQAKKITLVVVDQGTKAVEDQALDVLTYGNASAEILSDFAAGGATPGEIADAVLDEAAGDHTSGGSVGYQLKTLLDLISSNVAGVKTKTDGLNFTGTDVKATLDGEEVTVSGLATAGEIADAVLDEAAGDHVGAGSVGYQLKTLLDLISSNVAGVKTQTDGLNFVGTDVKATLDGEEVTVTGGGAMNLTEDAVDLILDEVVEGAYTLRQLLRLFASALFGKTTGAGTTTVNFRDLADAKNRIQATVDIPGNRSAIGLDAT